jgi:hypothetical protein
MDGYVEEAREATKGHTDQSAGAHGGRDGHPRVTTRRRIGAEAVGGVHLRDLLALV